MAYEYGVNLKLNSEKAVKDIDALLGKLKEMENLAGKVKLNLNVSGSVEKQQREFLKTMNQMSQATQKLATQQKLDAEKIAQAEDKTASQRLRNAEKVAQAEDKTTTQRIRNAEKIRREEDKTNTEAEKSALSVLKANEKVRQEKEKTRQEAQKAARQEEKTSQEALKTDQQRVEFITKLYRLYQMTEKQKQREEAQAQKIANAEQKAREQAEKRAQAEAEIAKKMAEQARLAAQQAMINNATSGFTNASRTLGTMGRHYSAIGRSANLAGNVLNNVSQSFYFLQNAASQFMSNIWGYTQRIGSQIISQVEKIADGAFEQYKTLETAEIGFSNFFNGSPTQFTQQVRAEAERMPGVSAQDLVRGIQYIAPLANGNSQLALSAAEGVMKSILYSGNDVSQYGTNALQNLMQLASGNFTYADIRQMLRAMPTLPTLLASTSTGGELLDNGAITTEKMKAYVKKYGQSAILELFKEISEESPAANIYDRYAATFSGIIEETGEILRNRWNDAMENSGLYRSLKNLLERLDKNGTIEKVMNKIGDVIARVVNFFNHEDTGKNLEEWFTTIQTVMKSFKTAIGQTIKELGKTLGIFNDNGSLNTAGIRQLTRDIAEFVKGLVQGFGGGLKNVIELVQRLKNTIGEDAFRKLGQVIGWLASPMGKLVGLTTKLAAGFTSLVGGLSSALGGVFTFLSKLAANGGATIAAKLTNMLSASGTATAMTGASASATNVAGYLLAQNPAGYLTAGSSVSTAAAAKVASINPSATLKAMQTSTWNSIKIGLTSMIGKITSFLVNLLRGGLIAGISLAAGQLINSVLDMTNMFGDATNGVKQFVSTLSAGIAGFALLFTVTGNPLVGAIGGLAAGIIGYTLEVEKQKQELQKANNAKMIQELDEQTAKDITSIADYIAEVYKTAGGNLDVETEEGRTAYDDLKTWLENKIVKYDENGNIKALDYGQFLDANGKVDPDKLDEAFALLANDLFQQKMNSAMADFTMTTDFASAAQTGSKVNLDTDTATRQRMYDLIVRNLLNGTDAAKGGVYDYTQSQEKVIRDYLQTIGMDDLTTGALTALESQESILSTSIQPDTVNIKDTVKSIDDKLLDDVSPDLAKVANATEGFAKLLTNISNNVMYIARKNNANFSTFGFNGTQLGSTNGIDVDQVYSSWKSATDKGKTNSFGDLYLRGNEYFGGYSVNRTAEGFRKFIEVFKQTTGLLSSDMVDENGTFAKNWKTLTTREKAAKAYGKDPDSNDDWSETYQKIMDAYNWEVSQQASTTPGSAEYNNIQKRMDNISMYADWIAAVPAGDWVTLFYLQDLIEKNAQAQGIGIDFRARGGLIAPIFRAIGGRGVDSVPAFLQPGEYVMRASATSKAGLGVMDALNRGDLGSAARILGAKFSNSWNNSRSYASTVNNNQKTVTNYVRVNNRTIGGRLNSYYSLANRLAASF